VARVLWYGDVGAHTGFARVTHAIANRLVRKGHEVHVLGLNYPGDWSPETARLRIYKADARDPLDTFGTKRIAEILTQVDPEAVVFLHDPAALVQLLFSNRFDPQRLLLNQAPIIAYLPVDGYNYPDAWTTMIPLQTNVVAMSRHGQAIFPGSKLVYHGIDEERFWPVSETRPIRIGGLELKTKADCKRHLDHAEDGFLILRVDANSGRKDYASLIHAVAPIMEAHREIELHLHAGTDPRMPGVNLATLISRYDIEDQVTITDPVQAAWSTEQLNVLYNAADLFVTTSRGEGFGLTIAEAMACGVPVIAQNVSAIPEVVGDGGVLIEPQRRITVPAGQDLWLPDVETFTAEVEALYFDRPRLEKLGSLAWMHVTGSFSWDYAADRFNDFIVRAAQWRGSTEAAGAVQQHE